MRKGISEVKSGTIALTVEALDNLKSLGFNFVQIKGLTIDNHYDYVEPHYLVLVPMRSLPTDKMKMDIYEPIQSDLLYKWAAEVNEYPEILIAKN